jgi:hypothetical protein
LFADVLIVGYDGSMTSSRRASTFDSMLAACAEDIVQIRRKNRELDLQGFAQTASFDEPRRG